MPIIKSSNLLEEGVLMFNLEKGLLMALVAGLFVVGLPPGSAKAATVGTIVSLDIDPDPKRTLGFGTPTVFDPSSVYSLTLEQTSADTVRFSGSVAPSQPYAIGFTGFNLLSSTFLSNLSGVQIIQDELNGTTIFGSVVERGVSVINAAGGLLGLGTTWSMDLTRSGASVSDLDTIFDRGTGAGSSSAFGEIGGFAAVEVANPSEGFGFVYGASSSPVFNPDANNGGGGGVSPVSLDSSAFYSVLALVVAIAVFGSTTMVLWTFLVISAAAVVEPMTASPFLPGFEQALVLLGIMLFVRRGRSILRRVGNTVIAVFRQPALAKA